MGCAESKATEVDSDPNKPGKASDTSAGQPKGGGGSTPPKGSGGSKASAAALEAPVVVKTLGAIAGVEANGPAPDYKNGPKSRVASGQIIVGPRGFCAIKSDGTRSCVTVEEVLAQVTELTSEDASADKPPQEAEACNKLIRRIRSEEDELQAIRTGLEQGELDQEQASRRLLDAIGVPIFPAVMKAVAQKAPLVISGPNAPAGPNEPTSPTETGSTTAAGETKPAAATKVTVSRQRPSSIEKYERQTRDFRRTEGMTITAVASSKSVASSLRAKSRHSLSLKKSSGGITETVEADFFTPSSCFTHEGGVGGKGKENQDAHFIAQPSDELLVAGVFDGHGKRYGQVAAQTAASTVKAFLCERHAALQESPTETLQQAFAAAHAAIRSVMLRRQPTMLLVGGGAERKAVDATPESPSRAGVHAAGGFLLDLYKEDGSDDAPSDLDAVHWDAADGGTTATVVVVIKGKRLIVAAVGDSSAALVGRDQDGQPKHQLLVGEHSPTSLAEFERISQWRREFRPRQAMPRFVYDCPDGEMIDVFGEKNGKAVLDKNAEKEADKHDCMVKTSRGDLVSCIVVPETTVVLPHGTKAAHGLPVREQTRETLVVAIDEQYIAMTRSLGDFYAHHHGVSAEPEIEMFNLNRLAESGWRAPHLLLATDGIWDMWTYDEVAERLVPAAGERPSSSLSADFLHFCESTRAKSCEYFNEAADNLTGVFLSLDGQK